MRIFFLKISLNLSLYNFYLIALSMALGARCPGGGSVGKPLVPPWLEWPSKETRGFSLQQQFHVSWLSVGLLSGAAPLGGLLLL